VLGALRKSLPEHPRPYRLPTAHITAPAAFVAANYIFYFAGWPTSSKTLVAVVIGFIVVGITTFAGDKERRPTLDWRPAVWVVPYFGGLAILSYLGSFDGIGVLPFGWDLLLVALFSIAVYMLAVRSALDPDRATSYIEQARDEAEEEAAEPAPARAPSSASSTGEPSGPS
jgi:hypothetical protein